MFRTQDSQPTLKRANADQLYAYITGIIKNKNSHLYRINGVENHLHILTDAHPSIALACKKTFEEEYRSLLQESGITIDERYFP